MTLTYPNTFPRMSSLMKCNRTRRAVLARLYVSDPGERRIDEKNGKLLVMCRPHHRWVVVSDIPGLTSVELLGRIGGML